MSRLWMSSLSAFRLLCGIFLLMAILDAPVTLNSETAGRLVGLLLVLGALAATGLGVRKRRALDAHAAAEDSTRVPNRKARRVAA